MFLCVGFVVPSILGACLHLMMFVGAPPRVPQEEGQHSGFCFSIFLLRCVPKFFSREGFGHRHRLPLSTFSDSNIVYPNERIAFHSWDLGEHNPDRLSKTRRICVGVRCFRGYVSSERRIGVLTTRKLLLHTALGRMSQLQF